MLPIAYAIILAFQPFHGVVQTFMSPGAIRQCYSSIEKKHLRKIESLELELQSKESELQSKNSLLLMCSERVKDLQKDMGFLQLESEING